MIPLRRVVDGVPRASAELEDRLALGVEERRFSRRVAVHRHALVPVARVPRDRVNRTLLA